MLWIFTLLAYGIVGFVCGWAVERLRGKLEVRRRAWLERKLEKLRL